ncbi:hypothetical protein [Rhizobium lentis]|uniref:hypothetical protein n=1 Tax=Rhizobium lentis TaxID=1138194 RepID=UPI001A927678|nr:hypothetical protein [Rhizobium lentis]QSW96705.1 hypothetical protein J0663_24750 [Rhizobium lentis]
MTIYNVSLIGFGGVNPAVAELIATKNEQWKRELGFAFVNGGLKTCHGAEQKSATIALA